MTSFLIGIVGWFMFAFYYYSEQQMDFIFEAIREVLIDKIGENWVLYINQTLASYNDE